MYFMTISMRKAPICVAHFKIFLQPISAADYIVCMYVCMCVAATLQRCAVYAGERLRKPANLLFSLLNLFLFIFAQKIIQNISKKYA